MRSGAAGGSAGGDSSLPITSSHPRRCVVPPAPPPLPLPAELFAPPPVATETPPIVAVTVPPPPPPPPLPAGALRAARRRQARQHRGPTRPSRGPDACCGGTKRGASPACDGASAGRAPGRGVGDRHPILAQRRAACACRPAGDAEWGACATGNRAARRPNGRRAPQCLSRPTEKGGQYRPRPFSCRQRRARRRQPCAARWRRQHRKSLS